MSASTNAGDQLQALFREHLSVAYRVALGVTNSPEDAEDAVQEAFVGLLRSEARLDPGGNARGYVVRASANAARQIRRERARRARREGARSPKEEAVQDDALQQREEQAAARGALAALDEELRLPAMLRFVEGFSLDDAAAALDLPRSTVDKRSQKALELLRRALAAAGFSAAVPAAVLASLPRPEAPAALVAKLGTIADQIKHGAAAGPAVSKGGLLVKIGLGIAAVGLVAGTTFLAAGGNSGETASPGATVEKVPGKDYPYGEGVVYKREVAAIGSLANGGYQDGPGRQMELTGGVGRALAPNGDWYFLDFEAYDVLVKYDAKKKRSYTIGWAGPYGKQGGPAECAQFAGGGYASGMGISMAPDGKSLIVHDRNNGGYMWKLDLETMIVEPTSGAEAVKGSVVRGGTPDGSVYFAKGDGKLMKVSPDGKTVQDLGVTLEGPLQMSSFAGGLLVNEHLGRLYAGSRDPYSPWGVFWYWDLKTGKATGLAGPKKTGGESGKVFAQDGGEVDQNFRCASGPANKVSFWCTGGPSFGPDRGERYLYIPGGDEPTPSRLDLEKMYVTKMVRADPKGDRSLWTFGEGKMGKDYKFADPYCWSGAPIWGPNGEYYMTWALCSAIDIYTPVQK